MSPAKKLARICIALVAVLLSLSTTTLAETPINLSGYQKDCEVRVEGWNGNLRLAWPTGTGETGVVTLDLSGTRPLIEKLAIRKDGADADTILGPVDPVWFLTVGERRAADEKGPSQQWEVFFDNPDKRPHETFASKL